MGEAKDCRHCNGQGGHIYYSANVVCKYCNGTGKVPVPKEPSEELKKFKFSNERYQEALDIAESLVSKSVCVNDSNFLKDWIIESYGWISRPEPERDLTQNWKETSPPSSKVVVCPKCKSVLTLKGKGEFLFYQCDTCGHCPVVTKTKTGIELTKFELQPTGSAPEKCPECNHKPHEPNKRMAPIGLCFCNGVRPDSAQPTPSEGLKEHTLRCPFCGELPDETDAQEVGNNYAVECPGCQAQGPIAEYPDWAFEQWERRVAQGQSTARSQEGRELERANRENTNLIIQNTRFLNALYEILALEEGRVKRSGKDIGHCGVIAKEALTASPEAKERNQDEVENH